MVRACVCAGEDAVESQLVIIAALGALLMGITLGVFGAGGSILTVPILTFILSYPPVQATHYSLFVVGVVSAVGVALNWKSSSFETKKIVKFALPAMAGMYLVKKLLLPSLPLNFEILGGLSITLNQLILGSFAIFMILAAGSMIFVNPAHESHGNRSEPSNSIFLIASGVSIGGVSGFVGAGGGFLIVPALVFLSGFPMKEASRASLFVIALNSLWGFVVGTKNWYSVPFPSLLLVIFLALVGMFLGLKIQSSMPASRLKVAFGYFVLLMGVYIFARSGG